MAKSYADFKAKYLYKSVDVDGFPTGQPGMPSRSGGLKNETAR